MRKTKTQKRKRSILRRLRIGSMKQTYVLFVAIAIGLGLLLAGALEKPSVSRVQNPLTYNPGTYTCCDSGNGENCKVNESQVITFRGMQYGLLKSNFLPIEKELHLQPATTNDGRRVFYNNRDDHDPDGKPGCPADMDWIVRTDVDGTSKCFPIPDEQIIYVCRDDNPQGMCDSTFGEGRYDAYYRLDGYPIPEVIKNCVKPTGIPLATGAQYITSQSASLGSKNLQLQTFSIESSQSAVTASWVSPWCKPAVYLYPEENMPVNVQVYPQGKMSLTIPKYPAGGWNVFAYKDGRLTVNDTWYDYLYWEAEMPDSVIEKPETGFVFEENELENRLVEVLTKLGLNERERQQFVEYWVKVLPEAPYYKVSLVPQHNIDTIAPLVIMPKPDSVLRVALYFEALDERVAITAPQLKSFTRNGFTVVEWGGFVKKDPHRPFSCMM